MNINKNSDIVNLILKIKKLINKYYKNYDENLQNEIEVTIQQLERDSQKYFLGLKTRPARVKTLNTMDQLSETLCRFREIKTYYKIKFEKDEV